MLSQTLPDRGGARGDRLTRLFDVDVSGALARFDAPALLDEGRINVIALDAIAERLGSRWDGKRQQIYDHVDRTLGRHLGDAGVFVRVSDVDYLIVQPDMSKFSAQASCFRYLRELLTYFLGDHREDELNVLQVTKLSGAGVDAAPADARVAEAHAAREQAEAAEAARALDPSALFVAGDGRAIRASAVLEPVLELKAHRRIGYRMARRVLDQRTDAPLSMADLSRLSRTDIERIDLAVISRGLERLHNEDPDSREPSLVLPVSYVTLSSQRGRTAVAGLFKQAQASVRRGLICEVCDIEGVPEGALLGAVSLMRPFCLFMVGRREAPFGPSNALAAASMQGASIECPPNLTDDAEFLAWARQAVEAGRKVARSVMLFRIPSIRHMAIASHLGATHASLRPAASDPA